MWEGRPPLGWFVDLSSPSFWTFVLVVLASIRFLRLLSAPEKPRVTIMEDSSQTFVGQVLGKMQILHEVYNPPWLWGRCGHLQTAAYGLLGHSTLKRTADERARVHLSDGTTVTFDIFEPLAKHHSGLDVTLCLTPGIANSSESNYIRTCVHYAQENGYRCAVLNHLGALVDEIVTSPRIFSYGGIEELETMITTVTSRYPSTKLICIGFSMGANITTQFLLNTNDMLKSRCILGLSVCQGYSATISAPMYHDWENGRRAYNLVIVENMKRLLRRNYQMAVLPHSQSGRVNEERLWAATSIIAVDEEYSRRVAGFPSVDEFYQWCSCLPHLHKLKKPMIFLNAHDDPIIPNVLWEPVKALASSHKETAFISTKHGGHLGFLEGDSFSPLSVTWLDKFIVQMANAATEVYREKIDSAVF